MHTRNIAGTLIMMLQVSAFISCTLLVSGSKSQEITCSVVEAEFGRSSQIGKALTALHQLCTKLNTYENIPGPNQTDYLWSAWWPRMAWPFFRLQMFCQECVWVRMFALGNGIDPSCLCPLSHILVWPHELLQAKKPLVCSVLLFKILNHNNQVLFVTRCW